MIRLSELKVMEDSFFCANTEYYKPSLYGFLEANFAENIKYSDEGKLEKMQSMLGKKAHDSILHDDLERIKGCISEVPKEFDEEMWRGMLPRIRDEVRKTLGLDFKPRSIFFEDRFPQGLYPFEKKGASSVTIFEGNANTGVYFLNKRISSFFSPIVLIHEQLHSCLSQNKSKEQIYIEWFEEGLCQWYSLLIYNSLTSNKRVIDLYRQRNYVYSKVKPEYNFTKRYFEYMKIFKRLYLNGGPTLIGKMLVDYLSNKRGEVNRMLEAENLSVNYLPKSDIENLLLNFTTFVEPEKVTPLEYTILKNALGPTLLDEISERSNAPIDVVKRCILRLNMKGMVVLKGRHIEINWRKKDLFDYGLIRPIYPL